MKKAIATGVAFVAAATGAVLLSSASHATLSPAYPQASPAPGIGTVNPLVTQANIATTICVSGWTATVRPSTSFTGKIKVGLLNSAHIPMASSTDYELDHDISIEVGGAPADPHNLWLERWYIPVAGGGDVGAHSKDQVENYLKREVCAGRMKLTDAQAAIRGSNWLAIYAKIKK